MRTLAAVMVLCALAVAAAPAHASCRRMTEGERRQAADAVFVGRVLAFRSSDGRATFRVRREIEDSRRIRRGDVVRVRADSYPSSVTLGWDPRPGERWRVYVQRRDGRWITNDCLGTRRV